MTRQIRFQSDSGPILVWARLSGEEGDTAVRLALDTGATDTVITRDALIQIGYDTDASDATQLSIMTAAGPGQAAEIVIDSIESLGLERLRFPILAYDFPAEAGFDGLLGLDFLRNHRITIDFNHGTIELN